MTVRPLRRILSQEAIVVTLLPYLLVSILIFFWLLPHLRSDLESQQSDLAGQVAGQVQTYLAAAEGAVQGVASIQLNEDLDWHHVQHVLDAQIESSTILRTLYVVGKDGHIIVSGLAAKNRGQREDLDGFDLSRSDIFIQTEQLHRPVWSDTFLSAVSGKVTAAIAIPSHDFTVIGEIDLDRLAQFLTYTATKKEQLILIIDQRGQVVADQSGKLTAQQLNLNNIPLIKTGTGSSDLLSGQFKINNRAMYGTITENQDLKWDILVGRPVDLLYHTSMITMIIFLSGLFVSLLFSSSASLYLARRLSLQFEGLASRARKLALGEQVTEWPRGNITEIRELADDLSRMADAVTTRERQLAESEERFRLIFAQHGAIMLQVDPISGKIMDANLAASRFYGYSLAELCSMDIAAINCLSPEEIAAERMRIADGEKSFFTFRHRLADGEVRTVEVHSTSIAFQNRQVLFSIIHDVTERTKIAMELVKLSQAVKQSPVTIVITDRDGNIEYVNPQFTQLTGYTPKEAYGKNPRILKSSLTPPETFEHLWHEITSGRVWEGNLCNRKKNNELYWEHARIAPVTNALGNITHFVAVKEDITEKLRVDSELKHNVTMFQTLYKLSLMSEESEKVLLDYCLEAAVRMTRSEIGYIYFMNEDETTLTLHAWSKDVMPACSIPFKPTVYQVAETGLWGEAARRRVPVITNDYEAPNPFKRGYPQGHVPIRRHMNIPLIIHGKIVLLAGVGNKAKEYRDEDVTGLTLLMSGMWRMIETRKAETALQESEERFREMFAQNYDAIIEFHPKRRRIVNANQEALSLFGSTLDELRLLRPDTYIDRKDFRIFAENLTQKKNPEGYTLTKATCYKKDGASFSASLKCKRVKLTNEEVILCSIRDITQKLLYEEEMRTTQAKLIQANKMTSLGMLVSGVAHEINNPNHCISVNTSVLKNIWSDISPLLWSSAGTSGNALLGGLTRDEVQTHVPQLFSGIIESSQRINAIIANMREFVRGGQSSHPGSFDINRIIESAAQILWHQINKHTDSFQCDLAEEIPLAYGNAQQIEQVLINLIINALQSLPKKAHGVRVTTEIDDEAGHIVITVRDEGKGMSSETLQRLSEPFFTTREEEGGTGLGLYISASIIKEYGGTLDFTSQLGKGTIATIRLPTVAGS